MIKEFSNSAVDTVLAASTSGQLPTEQVIFDPGELLFKGQYAAAAYCSARLNLVRRSALIAREKARVSGSFEEPKKRQYSTYLYAQAAKQKSAQQTLPK